MKGFGKASIFSLTSCSNLFLLYENGRLMTQKIPKKKLAKTLYIETLEETVLFRNLWP